MKFLSTLCIVSVFTLTATNSIGQDYSRSATKYADLYVSHLEPGERIVNTWWWYVTSETKIGSHIVRTFYPETKQLTSKVEYINGDYRKKDGHCAHYFDNGQLSSIGKYRNHRPDGEWEVHDFDGNAIWKGSYVDGRKNGLWSVKDSTGISTWDYIYEHGEEKKAIPYDEHGKVKMTKRDEKPEVMEESMPYISGCHVLEEDRRDSCTVSQIYAHLGQDLRYPKKARKMTLEGKAKLQFTVNKEGEVMDVQCLNCLCEDIERECKRSLSLLQWKPGIQKGKPVSVRYTQPIVFKLQ